MTSHGSRQFYPQETNLDADNKAEAMATPTTPVSLPDFAQADLSSGELKLSARCDDPGFRGSSSTPQPATPRTNEEPTPNRLGRESTGG